MLFRRQPKPPPTPPVRKSYNHLGENYEIVQWPDTGQVAVSAHGKTCYVEPERKAEHCRQSYCITTLITRTYTPFYPPIPVTRQTTEYLGWATTPQEAVERCCQFLQRSRDREQRKAATAAAPTPAQRMTAWLDQLPKK